MHSLDLNAGRRVWWFDGTTAFQGVSDRLDRCLLVAALPDIGIVQIWESSESSVFGVQSKTSLD